MNTIAPTVRMHRAKMRLMQTVHLMQAMHPMQIMRLMQTMRPMQRMLPTAKMPKTVPIALMQDKMCAEQKVSV